MLRRAVQSLYLKIFLSFLATCILFFVGLALFWNYYLSQHYFKDKRDFMETRVTELERIYQLFTDGSISTRELRFSMRVISRSFGGEAWIVDPRGNVTYSSTPEWEGQLIPESMDASFNAVMKGNSGFVTVKFKNDQGTTDSLLTRYTPIKENGKYIALYLFTPVDEILNAVFAVRWNMWLPLLFSLAAVGVILFTLSRRFAGPLQQINRIAHSITEGDFSIRIPVRGRDEVGQLAESFNTMLDKLHQWEDTRQEFLTNVSHELRSPLTTLRGLISGMSDGIIKPEQQQRYLSICIDEVKRLERLVSDLLELARIQNNADMLRLVLLDAVDISTEAIDFIAPIIEKKGLKLKVWVPDHPLPVMLDRDRYVQILNNLIYNAVQFTPEGRSISLFLGAEGEDFVLRVRDEGIGMSEEELGRIWDRFYKADPSRGIRPEGTGLGLTIVQHLAKAMNGSISVRSEHGKGTEFTVRFKLARDQLE